MFYSVSDRQRVSFSHLLEENLIAVLIAFVLLLV